MLMLHVHVCWLRVGCELLGSNDVNYMYMYPNTTRIDGGETQIAQLYPPFGN